MTPGYDVAIDGNNKATITKFYSTSTALTIPGTIDGAEVVAIGAATFKGSGIVSVAIPASVTNIDPSAFEGCIQLTTVTFGAGSGLLSIGQNAFSGCEKLDTITLPNQLRMIDDRAFQNCTSLKSLVLPASLITLGESAFSTTGLTAITIPNLVTSIKNFTFEKCPALTTVTLSANLQTLGSATFLDCDSLAKITIPASVNAIGTNTFQSCDSLTTVTFAAGSQLTAIPVGMFLMCTKLTDVNFNSAGQITTIGDRAFLGCSQLVTIDLPKAVTEIGSQAFKACSELTGIAIPDKVTSIKGSAFENCTKLDTVSFGPGSQLTVIGDLAFSGCPKLINITIPKLVNTIGSGAFIFDAGTKTTPCTYTFRGAVPTTFTANAIPTTPQPTIKYYAKYQTGFDALFVSAMEYDKQVILTKPTVTAATASYTSQPVVTLTWSAVADATTYDVLVSDTNGSFSGTPITVSGGDLTTDISSGLTSGTTYYFAVKARDAYGESLLSDSRSALAPYLPVSSVTLDKTTLSVGVTKTAQLQAALLPASGADPTVVWTSSNATIANVDANGKVTGIKEGGPVTITAKSADGSKSDTCTVTVTEGYDVSVTANKATLTKYYGDNKDVVIPEQIEVNGVMRDVVAIGDSAFAKTGGAHSITAVTIPASVTVIGASAFSNCRDLTTVTFAAGSTLATIGDDAFNSCGILSAIEIPATVISIGEGAFNACFALATVTFAADSQLTSIGNNVFNNCKFTTITIPASVTTIGSNAFQVCLSLNTVEFAPGSALTSIGQNAFYGCAMLSTIEIPAGVTTIDKLVFHGCSISTVTFAADSLLETIDQWAFNSCPLTSIQNIPAGVIINADDATMGVDGSGFIAAYAIGGSGTYNFVSTWTKQ